MDIFTAESVNDFERSLDLRGRGTKTIAVYARAMHAFFVDQELPVPAEQLADELAGWIAAARRRGLAPATLRQRLAIARSFVAFAGVERGPLGDLRLPTIADPVPHPLPGGMVAARKMIDAAVEPTSRLAIALGALAGLRVAETLAVTAENIDRVRGELVVTGKGEKTRRIPISAELAAHLADAPRSGRLVPMSNSGARRAITRTAELACVRGADGGAVSSHDLRATFGTEVYARTKDIVLVQRLLGHSSVTTTQVYIGVGTEQAKAAVEFI